MKTIPKSVALSKRGEFYDNLWKEQIVTGKMTRAEFREVADKIGPRACRECSKETEKKSDIGYRKICVKCTEKLAAERLKKKTQKMKADTAKAKAQNNNNGGANGK